MSIQLGQQRRDFRCPALKERQDATDEPFVESADARALHGDGDCARTNASSYGQHGPDVRALSLILDMGGGSFSIPGFSRGWVDSPEKVSPSAVYFHTI